jgi:TolA-binding protein
MRKELISVKLVLALVLIVGAAMAQTDNLPKSYIQNMIKQNQKELVDKKCDIQRSVQCESTLHRLGDWYYTYAKDYPAAKQTFQRLLKEYPNSQYSQTAKIALAEIEIISLPPEQQKEARHKAVQQHPEFIQLQQNIEQLKKQLTKCEDQKSDKCDEIIFRLGEEYHTRAVKTSLLSHGNIKGDYSMAKQTYQQLFKNYPMSIYLQGAEAKLIGITNSEIIGLPAEQQRVMLQQAEQQRAELKEAAKKAAERIKQQQAAEQAAKLQQNIEQYQKQLAECQGDSCAYIMYQLGMAYYSQAATKGAKGDYSIIKQMCQRLKDEYPNLGYWAALRTMLLNIEFASLPPEQQAVARQKAAEQLTAETIDHYQKQLAGCDGQKNDQCANILGGLGSAYYQQAALKGINGDYTAAEQMFQRLLKEYPDTQNSKTATMMLKIIEGFPKR